MVFTQSPEVCLVKQKVLIVDDEALLVRTLSQAFRDSGYRVTACASAEEAEAVLKRDRNFDLVLLDYRLPGKTGLDLLASAGPLPGTRVVLMTAYGTAEIEEKSRALGVNLYLKKPFDLGSLLSQASSLLEKGAGS